MEALALVLLQHSLYFITNICSAFFPKVASFDEPGVAKLIIPAGPLHGLAAAGLGRVIVMRCIAVR